MKKLITIAIFMFIPAICFADKPEAKSKFYDFGDQVINGEIKVPRIQPIGGKQKVEFERLLNLKKSFLSELEKSGKDSVFK